MFRSSAKPNMIRSSRSSRVSWGWLLLLSCWLLFVLEEKGAMGQTTTTATESVGAVIAADPEFSLFAEALRKSGRMALLEDTSTEYTVFAPTNAAVNADEAFTTYMTYQGWDRHLTNQVNMHILEGQTLSFDFIFDGERTILQALAGQMNVTQSFNLVQGQEVVTNSEQFATNGIVFTVESVLPNHFRLYNFYTSVGQQHELIPAPPQHVNTISTVIEAVGFQSPLEEMRTSGTTWIAPRNRGFGLGTDPIIIAEILNPNRTNITYDALLYNLIDINIYDEEFPDSSNLLIYPRNPIAQMWVSRDRLGIFRFNDAELVRAYMATNGPVYIVKRILTPPGLIESVGFCGAFTSIDVKEIHQYMVSTLWYKRNLSVSIGNGYNTGGYNYTAVIDPENDGSYKNFTMFVPMSYSFNVENREDIVRVATPMWIRHLQNFMGHMLIQPAMTHEELFNYVQQFEGNTTSLQMISGFNTTLWIDDNEKLRIDNAEFVETQNLKAVDGYGHYISEMPLPPSIEFSTYEQIQMHPRLSFLETLIDTVFLGRFIDNLLPVTYFVVPNDKWTLSVPEPRVEFVLRDHAYRGLLFTDVLKEQYNGKNLTNVDGVNYTIDVFNDTIYIDYYNPLTNSVIIEGEHLSNVLTRTGVIHFIDHLLVKEEYPAIVPTPTFAPIQQFGTNDQQMFAPGTTIGGQGAQTPPPAPAPGGGTPTDSSSTFPVYNYQPTATMTITTTTTRSFCYLPLFFLYNAVLSIIFICIL